MAGQKPDLDHPFGHGRIEYISGLIVSALILLMGFELVKTSIEKIAHPEATELNLLSALILLAAILVKGYMAFYNRRTAAKIDSAAMRATAMDSLSDMAATSAVLICSIIAHYTGLAIDGWCGLLVSGFILFSGYSAAKDTINPLLGQAPDPELIQQIQSIVMEAPIITGIHDLIIHDYGPGRQMISLHAEIPVNVDILKAHDMIDNIEMQLRERLGCDAVIHMDPIATDDALTNELRMKLSGYAHEISSEISIHDFRIVVGETHTNLIFDAVLPYQISADEFKQQLTQKVSELPGKYYAVINIDRPFV